MTDNWVVGHKVSRLARPELTWAMDNWQVECRDCSNRSANEAFAEKALADAAFSREVGGQSSAPLPAHTHGNHSQHLEVRVDLSWASFIRSAPAWLSDVLVLPEDASPPLATSAVHSEAVGTYGPEAVAWMEANLRERGRPVRLRWWQKLATYRQLEHRADGSLCWRVVLESTPRRSGKSTRLRAMALWRLEHGEDLFEPEQLVVHTGKDLAIVREVLRKAWPWAAVRDDWDLKKGMTEPEVSHGLNRWVARSKDSLTGYDACLAVVDESWDVKPETIDDDLEPSMLERQSPQLLLTSTAHRRATSLMRGRISAVLAEDDGETLLLWWGALPQDDTGDPAVWRAASPYWSQDRAQMIAKKFAKARRGEGDPELDDPDPVAGFRSQYLNSWLLSERAVARGNPLLSEDAWGQLCTAMHSYAPPDAVALESWFEAGYSLASAWLLPDGKVLVSVSDHAELATAVASSQATGCKRPLLVGASLLDDPALKGVRTRKASGRTPAAVEDLSRLLAEDALRHDGSAVLAAQVLAVRTLPSADGMRVTSKHRADAVKAAVWVATEARKPAGLGHKVILPSHLRQTG
ncbi:MAG: HNH endonuclease [Nocardioidaceae bacterium]